MCPFVKITHWVPCGERPPGFAVIDSWMHMETPDNIRPRFVRGAPASSPHLESWNKVCSDFLASGDEWLFSTHSDVAYAQQSLMRLLSRNQPLVSGLVFMKNGPALPHVWKAYDDMPRMAYRIRDTYDYFMRHKELIRWGCFVADPSPEDALTDLDFTSTSLTLIHRSVLEAMSPPWFEQYEYGGGGEDCRFFVNARAAGFVPYVDRSVIASHIPYDIPVSGMDFVMWTQSSTFIDTGEPEAKTSNG